MAIKPEEAAKLTITEHSQVNNLEHAIDNKLRIEWTGEPGQVVRFDLEIIFHPRVILALRRKYEQVGWQFHAIMEKANPYLTFRKY